MNNTQTDYYKNWKLSHHIWQKRPFDATSKTDLKEYQYFLTNSRWRQNCPFILEWPYLTIADMMKDKVIKQHLEMVINNAADSTTE